MWWDIFLFTTVLIRIGIAPTWLLDILFELVWTNECIWRMYAFDGISLLVCLFSFSVASFHYNDVLSVFFSMIFQFCPRRFIDSLFIMRYMHIFSFMFNTLIRLGVCRKKSKIEIECLVIVHIFTLAFGPCQRLFKSQ